MCWLMLFGISMRSFYYGRVIFFFTIGYWNIVVSILAGIGQGLIDSGHVAMLIYCGKQYWN